jgi:hypothetical protein
MVGRRKREAARPEYGPAGNSCKLRDAGTLANPVTAQESLGQAHGRKLKLEFIILHSDTRRIMISK